MKCLSKCIKLYFSLEYVCKPYLKFSCMLPETRLIFYLSQPLVECSLYDDFPPKILYKMQKSSMLKLLKRQFSLLPTANLTLCPLGNFAFFLCYGHLTQIKYTIKISLTKTLFSFASSVDALQNRCILSKQKVSN